MNRLVGALFIVVMAVALPGCTGFKKIGQSEYGVVFSALPTWLGGGLQSKVLQPGEMEFLWPWESLYSLDVSLQTIAWGAKGQGSNPGFEDYVETRAADGNEVDLGMTIQYRVDSSRLRHVMQYVGVTDARVRQIVEALARSDIRTQMNVLHTREFLNTDSRSRAAEQVKNALNTRLQPEGIIVADVIYDEHRFERKRPDGTSDFSYQTQLDETQAIEQETEREEKRILTVVEQKKREQNEMLAKMNQLREEAEGNKRQAAFRGDAYLASKSNEAEQIRAAGMAEVAGLKKQIAALNGPGGAALLRLTVARELLANNPKFILLNSGAAESGGKVGFDFNRLDTNALLRDAGILGVVEEEQQSKMKRLSENAGRADSNLYTNSDAAAKKSTNAVTATVPRGDSLPTGNPAPPAE